MATPNDKPAALDELRSALKDQFATAHRDFTPRESISWGIDWLDDPGIQKGTLCEISSPSMAAGAMIVNQILRHVVGQRERLVLIDGSDSFDPASLPIFGDEMFAAAGSEPTALEANHNLDGCFAWARCRSIKEAVRVADMILRDGNLPRTVIDLQNNPACEMSSTPRSSWLRLRSLVEDAGVSCLILTPQPLLTCAPRRFEIEAHFSLDDLGLPEQCWQEKISCARQKGRALRGEAVA